MCRPPWSWPGKGPIRCHTPAGQTALDTPGEAGRAEAHRRRLVLRAHLEDGVPLARVAAQSGIPHRTLQRWLAPLPGRRIGRPGPGRARRPGPVPLPRAVAVLVEGLALRTPVPSAAQVHRQVTAVAEREGWPVLSYSWVYAIICGIDPALRTLAVEGDRRYAEVFELVYRRQASRPNEIWQADHTQLALQHHWSKLSLTLSADDFTDAEALAAVARITGGNFRLVQRLFAQIQRIMEINNQSTITREVVETARESLVIGSL